MRKKKHSLCKTIIEPSECVVVEDAYAGIDAAKAAGMTAVGIGDAAGYEKADYKIHDFSELLKIR